MLGIFLLAGVAALGHWLVNRWSYVHVDDSRIAADVITLSSEVSGRVTAIPVLAGDRVSRGDLLVRIESRQAELLVQQTDAEMTRIEAGQSELRTQQAKVRSELDSRGAAARAQLEAAEAEQRAAQAALDSARSDYERLRSLRAQGMVSAQALEAGRARFLTAQEQELRGGAGVRVARAGLAVVEAQAREIDVLERRIAVLQAEQRALAARRAQQLVDLGQREIRAAFGGVIDAKFVDAGEYVSPGTRLLMYHDPGTVWVDANVKETDFRKLKIGARATVTVDAYPGRAFEGEVARLGEAATSQFALLPSPNPSGNFTKVTQRLPVRIALAQDGSLLRPGMMVEVQIDVSD